MNNLLQNISGFLPLLLCLGTCIVGIVGIFLFSFFADVLNLILSVVNGGPESWCGCIVLFGLCGAIFFCVGIVLYGNSTCGTSQQIMLCRFLGY